jgi:integrase
MFKLSLIDSGAAPRLETTGKINSWLFQRDSLGTYFLNLRIALMLTVSPEPSRTVVATAAFTGLRAGEIRGLSWKAFTSGTDGTLGVVRVLRSIWRGRIGEPKNSRSKASVPLIPQLNKFLEQHRQRSGNPAVGPIFANGAGKPVDLDSLYHRQMKEPLKEAGIEWEGCTFSARARDQS